jgi:hypothetical protein
MISRWLYWGLLEDNLEPPEPRGINHSPQSKWIREDNLNMMYQRDIDYPMLVTAPEAKQMVNKYLKKKRRQPVMNKPRVTITTDEI